MHMPTFTLYFPLFIVFKYVTIIIYFSEFELEYGYYIAILSLFLGKTWILPHQSNI